MTNGTDTFSRSFKMSRTNTTYNQKKDPYNAKKIVQGPPREIGIPNFKIGQKVKVKPFNIDGIITRIGVSSAGFKYLVKTANNETMWVSKTSLLKGSL